MKGTGALRANVRPRRFVAFAFALLLAASTCLSGCTAGASQADKHRTADGRTIVRISLYNSSSFPEWRTYVEQQCLDVSIEWEDNRNVCSNVVYEAEHGNTPDIIGIRKFDSDSARKLEPYLADLSSLPLTSTFNESALVPFQDGGKQYWLPEPGTTEGMWANKTLFDQYGMALPTDMDSFVSACRQMEANGKVALATSCTQGYSCVALIEGFGSAGFLDSNEGVAWRKAFESGTANSVDAEGFSDIADTLRTLRDNGIVTDEDLTATPTSVSTVMNSGQAAITVKASDALIGLTSSYQFVALPYFGETADDSCIYTYPVFSVALSKDSQADASRKAASEEVLNAMMSADAQKLLNAASAGLISYNKDIELDVSPSMESLRPLIKSNRIYIRSMNSNTFTASQKALTAIVRDQADTATFESVFNENMFKTSEPKVVGSSSVEADRTVDSNRCTPAASIIVQTVRAKAGTDMALIDMREIASPIYKGSYTSEDVAAVVFSDDVSTATLTGAQIKALMKSCLLYSTTFHQGNTEPIIDYPALAGTTVTMLKDGTIIDVKDANGASLDADKSYTVAISSRIASALKEDGSDLTGLFQKKDFTLITCLSEALASSSGLPKAGEYFDVQ